MVATWSPNFHFQGAQQIIYLSVQLFFQVDYGYGKSDVLTMSPF